MPVTFPLLGAIWYILFGKTSEHGNNSLFLAFVLQVVIWGYAILSRLADWLLPYFFDMGKLWLTEIMPVVFIFLQLGILYAELTRNSGALTEVLTRNVLLAFLYRPFSLERP